MGQKTSDRIRKEVLNYRAKSGYDPEAIIVSDEIFNSLSDEMREAYRIISHHVSGVSTPKFEGIRIEKKRNALFLDWRLKRVLTIGVDKIDIAVSMIAYNLKDGLFPFASDIIENLMLEESEINLARQQLSQMIIGAFYAGGTTPRDLLMQGALMNIDQRLINHQIAK